MAMRVKMLQRQRTVTKVWALTERRTVAKQVLELRKTRVRVGLSLGTWLTATSAQPPSTEQAREIEHGRTGATCANDIP